jgi:hypothetical protein
VSAIAAGQSYGNLDHDRFVFSANGQSRVFLLIAFDGATRLGIIMTVLTSLRTRFRKFTLDALIDEAARWTRQGRSIFEAELKAMLDKAGTSECQPEPAPSGWSPPPINSPSTARSRTVHFRLRENGPIYSEWCSRTSS